VTQKIPYKSAQQIRGVSALKKFPYKKSAQQIGDSVEQKKIPILYFCNLIG
jgi:hypothetical protein